MVSSFSIFYSVSEKVSNLQKRWKNESNRRNTTYLPLPGLTLCSSFTPFVLSCSCSHCISLGVYAYGLHTKSLRSHLRIRDIHHGPFHTNTLARIYFLRIGMLSYLATVQLSTPVNLALIPYFNIPSVL